MHCNLCGVELRRDQPPLWRKDGFEIVRCQSCGIVFRRDLPLATEVMTIYRQSYFRSENGGDAQGYADYLGDHSEHRLTARKRLDRIEPSLPPGRLLDVGCAAGFFIAEAAQRGWDARGIDVSSDMTGWGREHLGLDIATGLFQEASYSDASFDCVTMWDYIEHSVDPAADFAKAAAVLRADGRLFLSTGDVRSFVARVSGRRWHLLTPRHHNFFFSPHTLCEYLRRYGFEAVRVTRPSAYYSLRYTTHKLGTMAPRSRAVRAVADWTARRRLGEYAIPLNLFDIVTIEARLTPAAVA
jgi:2-polyprenyl-3-methyl-5-hydroxy-6-metoxy-1,4-benzoquinol methylase